MTTPSNTDVLPRGTRIGRTALRVNDLGELTRFYRSVVGLSVLDETDTRSVLGAADTPLLVLERDADAPTRHRSGAGLYHTAFRVPSRAALVIDNQSLPTEFERYRSEPPRYPIDARLDPSRLEVYACGLNAMVSSLVEAAERLGVPPEHTQFEGFG